MTDAAMIRHLRGLAVGFEGTRHVELSQALTVASIDARHRQANHACQRLRLQRLLRSPQYRTRSGRALQIVRSATRGRCVPEARQTTQGGAPCD
jgi:hypothetical protein